MAALTWIFDVLLGVGLLTLAISTILAHRLFQAIVMFMSFGLLLALSWARLQAPDLALAEAAIGAGVTGALFLNTLGRLHTMARAKEQEAGEDGPGAAEGAR